MKFENKDLIRDILLSRSDVDYFSISKSNFLNLEFNHIAFHGNGRRLIQKHLGRMWQETKEDYELFIADILGNHLYYELFNPETEKIVNIEESLDESAQPIEKLMNESLSIEIDRSLSIFSHRDNEVVSLFFGLTSHMIRHQDSCSMSIKLTLEKAAEKNRELTKSEIEHIQSCKNKIALFSECLDNRTGLSIPDLAKMFDCSPERIRQIKEKVILRLRNNSYMSEKLAYYLDYIPGWYQRQKKRREYKESW